MLEEVRGTRLIGILLAEPALIASRISALPPGRSLERRYTVSPFAQRDDPHVGVDGHRFIVCGDDRCLALSARTPGSVDVQPAASNAATANSCARRPALPIGREGYRLPR